MPSVTGRDEPWSFFHLWRHHFWPNWHRLCSTSAGGKDLSNNTQIRVIGLMEPEICTKMLKKLSEKLGAKFPATRRGLVLHGKNCPSRWRFLRTFLTASKPSKRSITAAKRNEKEEKERRKKIKNRNFDFSARPRQNVVKRDASGKKDKLPCCKWPD